MKIYKTITTPIVDKIVCDVNNNNPAYCSLTMSFGYGSGFDGDLLTLDLSATSAERILDLLNREFGNDFIKKHTEDRFS